MNPIHLDPALLLPLPQSSELWMLDCGDLHLLSLGELQRISTLFLTHGHIDHWIGLDQVLRAQLFCPHTLRVLGPPGTLAMLSARLAGYAWNLVADSPYRIEGYELSAEGWIGQLFPCAAGFQPTQPPRPAFPDLQGWQLAWVELEHGVPCLGYRLESPLQLRFRAEEARALGWSFGAWVEQLKESYQMGDPERRLLVGGEWRRAGSLFHLLEPRTSFQLAYVTDTRLSPEIRSRVTAAFGSTQQLWCEAAFLETQRQLAESKLHATAREAALLARELGCRQLHLFHLSRRSQGQPEAHLLEAREVFPATVAGSPEP